MFSVTYILLITSSIALLPSAKSDPCYIYDVPCTSGKAGQLAPLVYSKIKVLRAIDLQAKGICLETGELKVEGMTDCTIPLSEANPRKSLWLLGTQCPNVKVTSDYKMTYEMDNVKFEGEGCVTFELENLRQDLTLVMETLTRDDGVEYLNFKPDSYWFKLDHAATNFANLKSNDTQKVDDPNKYLDKDWALYWQQFGGYFLDILNDAFVESANEVLKEIPYTDLATYTRNQNCM